MLGGSYCWSPGSFRFGTLLDISPAFLLLLMVPKMSDPSKCANDTKPGGVLSTEKKQDMLNSLNDLGEWNDSEDMGFKVTHACRD